jgi:hypothetical protein
LDSRLSEVAQYSSRLGTTHAFSSIEPRADSDLDAILASKELKTLLNRESLVDERVRVPVAKGALNSSEFQKKHLSDLRSEASLLALIPARLLEIGHSGASLLCL